MTIVLYGLVCIFLAGAFVIIGDAILEHYERRTRDAHRRLAALDRVERQQREQACWPWERDAA